MTVREWFRLQRAEMWRENRDGIALVIDQVATAIVEGHSPIGPSGWVRIDNFTAMVSDVEGYTRRLRAFAAVEDDMQRAIDHLTWRTDDKDLPE
jgi:hypothetical protein